VRYLEVAWAWLRGHKWVVAAACAGLLAILVAVALRGCKPTPSIPQAPPAASMLVEEGRHEGAAEVLEQQAAEAGSAADAIEGRLMDAGPKPKLRKPLEAEDDEAVSRDLGDLVRRLRQ
jgi:hypothetical protein